MARRTKRGKGRAGRRMRRFRRRVHRKAKGGRYGYKGHVAIKTLGSSSWFPPRQVVKGIVKTDWASFGPTVAVITNYTLIANTTNDPFGAVSAAVTSYGGLSTILDSVSGHTSSVYQWYRVLYVKLTVEVMSLGPVGATGIEFFVYPHNPISGVAPNMETVMQQKFLKTMSVWPATTSPKKMTISMNPRKFMGLTKATYGQDEYYGAAGNDPVNKIDWIFGYQSVPAGIIPFGAYAWRFKQEAIIELSEPYDANDLPPT